MTDDLMVLAYFAVFSTIPLYKIYTAAFERERILALKRK